MGLGIVRRVATVTPNGYEPVARATFGVALAGVAGALTGLLFAALSVKGTRLSESRPLPLLARAGGGLYSLIPAVATSLVGGVP
jgi:hypothetical protein